MKIIDWGIEEQMAYSFMWDGGVHSVVGLEEGISGQEVSVLALRRVHLFMLENGGWKEVIEQTHSFPQKQKTWLAVVWLSSSICLLYVVAVFLLVLRYNIPIEKYTCHNHT